MDPRYVLQTQQLSDGFGKARILRQGGTEIMAEDGFGLEFFCSFRGRTIYRPNPHA